MFQVWSCFRPSLNTWRILCRNRLSNGYSSFQGSSLSLMNDISRLQVISFVLKRPHLMLRRPLATRADSMHTSAFRGKADIAAKTYSARHVRRGSTRRPKAPLPPHLAATVDSLRSQNGDHFVFSWAVPTRRTYLILSLHYDGAVSYSCKFWTGGHLHISACDPRRTLGVISVRSR